jgi:hypothetical protein
MPFPAGAPAKIAAKVDSGELPRETPPRVWAGMGGGKPCNGCGEVIDPSQVEVEFETADGRTVRLHLGCASLLEAEQRRRRGGPA